ncbi:MAG: hypothetical protein IJ597_04185, partial [Synergistaceae bacterium]|nr:hypothetical protein [Synergistaceae bacterium]
DNAKILFKKETRYFELFRDIFSDGKFNVSAITISRRKLNEIEGETAQSSVFHGVLEFIPFKGFDASDMEEYFNVFSNSGIELNDFQKQRIIYYAGNVPYLLSIIGHSIIEAFDSGENIDIDRIFEEKCKSINDYYRDCIKHLERDDELKRIIPFIKGPKIGVTMNDKQELFNIGYFSEENGKLTAISEYFSNVFLSPLMLNIDIWPELMNLEKTLKRLIERELTRICIYYSVAGKDFNEVFEAIMKKIPEIDVGQYKRYRESNKKYYNVDSSYLEVISMHDSIKIIHSCWDIFSEYFNQEPYENWSLRFQKCYRARNPLAHAHEEYLSELDVREINVYCKQICDTLKETFKSVKTDSRHFYELEIYGENSEKLNIENPVDSLLNKKVKMHITDRGKKTDNLRGIVEKKYNAVIPSNRLSFTKDELKKMIGSDIDVILTNINGNFYEAKPLKNN